MKYLIFYKQFDNRFNKYQYIFKITNKIQNNIIYNFGKVQNEFHIIILYNAISQLWITNMSNIKEYGEPELFDDLNEIHFMSDLNEGEDFDIFIKQIIDLLSNYLCNDGYLLENGQA